MRRMMVVAALVVLLTAACSSGDGGQGSSASTTTDQKAADVALILTMYHDINQAFPYKPDDGIRAVIAAQYPGDRADVDFARCLNAIVPGAKTLPSSKRIHMVPNVLTTTLDSGYTLTSNRVKGLHPRGRIYVTNVTMTDGGRPTVHQRHQVVLDGKAYQFPSC
jgi:hypothetical protein